MNMGLENLLSRPEGVINKKPELVDTLTPLQLMRDSSGALTVSWHMPNDTDQRTLYISTLVWSNSEQLLVKSFRLTNDGDNPSREEIITLEPNDNDTTYQTLHYDQKDIKTVDAVLALQAVRTGVEMYAKYKQSSPEEQKGYEDDILDQYPVRFEDDTQIQRINYIFGIWKKEREAVKQD